jgi:hypothetical protein
LEKGWKKEMVKIFARILAFGWGIFVSILGYSYLIAAKFLPESPVSRLISRVAVYLVLFPLILAPLSFLFVALLLFRVGMKRKGRDS